jgi:hypothetical protein
VIVPDTTTVDEREFERVVGRGGFSLRQLAFRFSVQWTNDHPDIAEDFTVTPEMRREFYRMITEVEGLEVDEDLFEKVGLRVDRFLEAQIANSAFGEIEMFKRFEARSPMYQESIRLLEEADSPEDLLNLAMVEEWADERSADPDADSNLAEAGTSTRDGDY